MTIIRPLLISFLVIHSFNLQLPSVTALNISYIVSTIIFSGEANLVQSVPDHTQHTETTNHSLFLKDVLKTIAARKKWNWEKIRVIELEKPRFAYSKRYDYRIKSGRNDLIVRLSKKLEPWNRFDTDVSDFEVAVNEVSSKAVLPVFVLDGPLELLVHGDDRLSLLLPLNTSFRGLKRVVVGEGIRVNLTGVQGFSFIHKSCSNFSNGSSVNGGRSGFWSLFHPLCIQLVPVQILGSASLVAFKPQNSYSAIKTKVLAQGTVELKPDKCYAQNIYRSPACGINSLDPNVAILQKISRRYLGERIHQTQGHSSSAPRVKVEASTVVQFQLGLERDVGSSDFQSSALEEWRTKPTIERLWFDVVARVDGEKLQPLSIKGVRPFISLDSAAWSEIVSNISFTRFPTAILPPQPLTLDIKW